MLHKTLVKIFGLNIAHKMTLWKLGIIENTLFRKGGKRSFHTSNDSLCVMDIRFRHSVGVGPGIDRNGKYLNTLFRLGLSYIETGPASLEDIRPIINNIRNRKAAFPIAVCIEKNHESVFSLSYDFADFFVFDVPEDSLFEVMDEVIGIRMTNDNYKPIVIKLSHNHTDEEFLKIIGYSLLSGIDGLEVAGIDNVRKVSELSGKRIPIIGYGGIRSASDVSEMKQAGASLVNITTAIHMEGTAAIRKIIK